MILPKNSINIYKKLVQKECLSTIDRGQHRQFLFGLDTLASRPFVSLNSNARTSLLSRSAAESKMARLLKNSRLRQQLTKLHLKLSGVTEKSILNVDHSELNGLSVLMFARQTRTGRSIPIYLETMPSLVQGHKRNSPLYQAARLRYRDWKDKTGLDQYGYTLHCLTLLRNQLGYMPMLVFDRGFCNKRILKYLKRQKILGYIRARDDFYVATQAGVRLRINEFTTGSHLVRYGCQLRLVVGEQNEHGDRIYVLTTDLKQSNETILKIYYYRFEVEELFRDMKSILHVSKSRLKKPEHMATLLWFVCLGIVLLHLTYTMLTTDKIPAAEGMKQTPRSHQKKKLSVYRQLLENFEASIRHSVYVNNSSGFS